MFRNGLRSLRTLRRAPALRRAASTLPARPIPWGQAVLAASGLALGVYALTPTVYLDHPPAKGIPYAEVQRHNTPASCWVVINGEVYDVTAFLASHPGGAGIILANGGRDVSRLFGPLHAPDALASLPPGAHLGRVDPATLPAPTLAPEEEADAARMAAQRALLPPVDAMLLLSDFEAWAERVLSRAGWAYYRSAADSETSLMENSAAFARYFFRPRVLRDITEGSLETEVCGTRMAMPVFIAPAAMAKLGHPLGEVNLTRGAAAAGIVQGVSINSSCGLDEILAARAPGQALWFQIYLNKDRAKSAELLRKVTAAGVAAVIFTVDVAWQSKRTRDRRAKTAIAPPPSSDGSAGAQGAGVAAAISGYQDPHLVWDDIDFIRKHTNLPIIVKGLQSVEDIARAAAHPAVSGVIISNHGGRAADFAPAPIDVLYELRALRPEVFEMADVLLDGGVRSGADAVKALALGAKAVGLGRPFLYANGTHGQAGVERVCEILEEEITNTMRNCGASRIDQLEPALVGPRGPWVGANRPPWLP